MLHVRCVELVLIAMNSEGPGYRTVELVKARKIIARLMAALTEQDSVSKSLYYLYDYCHALLGRANEDDCKNALKILKTLRNTFEELLKTL
jgi:flagellin-specific chaperone FliS